MPSINYNGLGAPAIALPVAEMLRGLPGIAFDFADQRRALSTIPGAEYLGPVSGLPGLSFARASAASYLDAAGNVQFAASGQPRFTHDATTFAPLGFLAEAARTNALANPTWSGPITPTSWNSYDPSGVSVVPSLFGSNVSARRFTATGNRPRLWQWVTLTAGVTYTVSAMVEQITGSITAQAVSWANVANTTTTFLACPANPTGGQLGMVRAGLFVWQITSTVTQSASIQFGLGMQASETGVTIDISQPQVEAGAFPTSFIPGGTRATDNLVSPLLLTPSTAFTLAVQCRLPPASNATDSNVLLTLCPPTGFADRVAISSYGYSTVLFSVVVGGVTLINTGIYAGNTIPNRDFGVAISWSPDRQYRAVCLGGDTAAGLVKFPVATPPSSNLSRITWGSRVGNAIWGSTINGAAIWAHDDFSDDQLKELSAL